MNSTERRAIRWAGVLVTETLSVSKYNFLSVFRIPVLIHTAAAVGWGQGYLLALSLYFSM